jgi:PAS domain S-box-containing protein
VLGEVERLLLTRFTVDRWPDPVLWIEKTGRIIYANDRACDTLGYSRDELLTKKIMELDPDFDEADLPRRWAALVREGQRSFEARLRASDGVLLPMSVTANHVTHEGREFDVCILKDLSQRKEAQARFQEMAELLPEVIFEADLDLNLTYTNRRGFELFGYTREDVRKGLNGLEVLAPEDRARARFKMKERLKGKDPGALEYTAMRKDGSTFPVLFHAAPILRQGEMTGIRGIIVDLSERKQLEDDLRQAQKMEGIGRLSGGVAHDLNNLLSPILGYGEMLQAEFGPEDERREAVEEIVRAAERARDLVRQLLAFSRRQTLEFKAIEVSSLVRDFEKLLRRTIREDIEVELELGESLPTIQADRGQVEQVIMNLAVNAEDAMPRGGRLLVETALVELDDSFVATHRGAEEGPHVMLAVRDDGVGMDEDTMKHVFEPFFTTKSQGTGLGLATVYGIVKQHGGSIWVQSEVGKGTEVACYFPVVRSEPDREPARSRGEEALSQKGTVMVVEDEPAVRKLAVTALERQGYTLLSAGDGQECLEVLEGHTGPVDLLLTDVVLPGMDGRSLFEKVKELYPDTKGLFMSGYSEEVITHHGVLDEGIALVQKPFSIRYLVQRVREIVQGE